MSIVESIASYIERKGIKQVYIAKEAHISSDRLSKLRRGERKMLADEFLRICAVINIPIETFSKNSESEKSEQG